MATNGQIAGIVLQFVGLLLPLSVLALGVVFGEVSQNSYDGMTAEAKTRFIEMAFLLTSALVVAAIFAALSLRAPSVIVFLDMSFIALGVALTIYLGVIWMLRYAFRIKVKRVE